LDQAEIVAGELIGNAVRHAPGNVTVIGDASGSTPVLHVIDEGPGFEFNPRLPADAMSDGGRGLFIINALVEEMSIARRTDAPGSHARVVLRKVAGRP
jgi:anti-sigma regulatory factor (Ser/Thr protein kinase)